MKTNRGITSPPGGAVKDSTSCSLTTEDDNEWLTSVEAAAYLKISVGQIRNLTSNGKVPYYKFGRCNRYRLEELRQLLLAEPRGERNVEV